MGATAHRLVKGDRTLRIPLTTSISSDIVGWAKASSLSHVQSVSVLPFGDNWCSGVRAPLITAAVFTYPAIKPFRREVHTVMIVQLYDYFVKRICRWHMQPTWALYSIMTSYLDHRPRRVMHVSCQPGMPPPTIMRQYLLRVTYQPVGSKVEYNSCYLQPAQCTRSQSRQNSADQSEVRRRLSTFYFLSTERSNHNSRGIMELTICGQKGCF